MKDDSSLFDSVFGKGGTFDSIFGKALMPERFSTADGAIRIEVELPGVDPATVSVWRSATKLRACWTSRLGEPQIRDYEVSGEVTATYGHGLLRIDVKTPPAVGDCWTAVEIVKKA